MKNILTLSTILLLDSLMGLRFQFWRPGLARVGAKARALRQ